MATSYVDSGEKWGTVNLDDFFDSTSNINTTYTWVKQRGKEIIGYIHTNSITLTGNSNICKVKSAYYPSGNYITNAVTSLNEAAGTLWVRGSDGGLRLENAISSKTILFNIHYLLS